MNIQESDKSPDDKFDIKEEVQETEIGLNLKQIKALAKKEFAQSPDSYYPTKVFYQFGFHRAKCPKCNGNYWRRTEKRTTCGDSNCLGTYTFIGTGMGIGKKGQKITYGQAWKGFQRSLTSCRIPCKTVNRYPVVARWRNDVDFTAAGIYCFQPFCVTGELEPPENPLIQPQFCVRFNDLDNIGLLYRITGRHYSGFVMLGIQTFNSKDKYVFFKEEAVEFNYRWLVEELEIDPDEITFIEDVWAGGGNLGPSVEYFVGGLEVGNIVFMQYKVFPNGDREELEIKVIDTGIGLERIPWLINGIPTSYDETFKFSLAFLRQQLDVNDEPEIWAKLGPLSCMLDADEAGDHIGDLWKKISNEIGISEIDLKKRIQPLQDLYIIVVFNQFLHGQYLKFKDHSRTVFITIIDGSLPSNVGGGGNVRNILRRVFGTLKRNNWWQTLTLDGYLNLFNYIRKDLQELYGEFPPYKSFNQIISLEYQRWKETDQNQLKKLDNLFKKNKILSLQDWITAMTTFGLTEDQIESYSKQIKPPNLYVELELLKSKIYKKAETILYNTANYPETLNLSYDNVYSTGQIFKAEIIDIFYNVQDNYKKNIVILDQSAFYPTSGGQQNDTGILTIDEIDYNVVNVEKVGKCVLHILQQEVTKPIQYYRKMIAFGKIDPFRRSILRNHHTATHIVFAACRSVLGPHVWQNGAKKTTHMAHLDITHYQGLSKDQEQQIENMANTIVLSHKSISKTLVDKAIAEKQYGFRLYQGGVIPDKQLRVVNIEQTDVEACCGTHCENTSQVGWIKLIKSTRISDGILRLYYVAGSITMERLNQDQNQLNEMCNIWSCSQNQLVQLAKRFLTDYKRLSNDVVDCKKEIVTLQINLAVKQQQKLFYVCSKEENPTIYFQNIGEHADLLKNNQKGIIFLGQKFIYSFIGDPSSFDNSIIPKIIMILQEQNEKVNLKQKNQIVQKKKQSINNIIQFDFNGNVNIGEISKYLESNGFLKLE